MFYERQLKQQIFYSFKLLILIYQYQFFPILMVKMLFSQIQQASGPNFRMVG